MLFTNFLTFRNENANLFPIVFTGSNFTACNFQVRYFLVLCTNKIIFLKLGQKSKTVRFHITLETAAF